MERSYKIYMHKNKTNGKVYIGQTKQDVERRWLNGEGYRTQSYFYNAINKYGWDGFEHIVLFENLTVEEANEIEENLINKYNSTDREFGYNRKFGGDNYCVNEDTKKQMSLNHADVSGENNPNYGKHHSDETKQKISYRQKQRFSDDKSKHPMYGKHHSEEARRKQSEAKSVKVEMYNLDCQFIKLFNSIKEASIKTNTNKDCISLCCKQRLKTAGGYIWKYAS